ncbi:MAG: transposase [Desulfurococcaceae archaeon]
MLNVRPYTNKQPLLFSPSIDEFISKNHLARVIDEVVELIDLEPYYQKIPKVGNPSYHPALMIKIWFYGYCVKTFSSRKIEEKLHTDIAFIYLAGMQKPDFKTISEFRRKYLNELRQTFVEILQICPLLGMIQLSNIAMDSKVMKANASANRTYTERELLEEKQELERAIQEYLERANQTDEEEGRKYGSERLGNELPKDIQEREKRIKKMRQMVEELRQVREKLKFSNKKINLTDRDAQFQRDKSRKTPGYRAQIAVDSKQQVIVANDVSTEQADQRNLLPMIEQVIQNVEKLREF